MKTFTKISVFAIVLMFSFGVVSYVVNSDLALNTAFAQSSCGGCGDDGGGDGPGGGEAWIACMDPEAINYTPSADGHDPSQCVYPAPSCDSFTANPKTIDKGDTSLLKWTTSNATKVELERVFGTQEVATDGSQTVKPGNDFTFRLTVYGHNGQTDTCTAPVQVREPQPAPAPTCDSFYATPSTITEGETSLLKWRTSNATKVELTRPLGTSVVDADGSQTVQPGIDRTFTLTVYGDNQQKVTCTTEVEVNKKPTPTPAPTCDSFYATPSTITEGDSSLLKWTTSNATKVELTRPFGTSVVAADGSQTVQPGIDRTFTLTVYGENKQKVTCTTDVEVNKKPTPTPAPTCDSFYATPSTITEGETSLLKWRTSNATRVELTRPIGTSVVNANGSQTVKPGIDRTFTLTVYGDNQQKVTCTTEVEVEPKTQPNPAPTCDSFYATPKTIEKGDTSLLKWSTSNATRVELTRPIGTTEVNANGSQTIKPGIDRTYTLTVYGADQQQTTCTASVTVETNPQPNPAPTCDSFTATPGKIDKGDTSLLEWETSYATRVELTRPNGVQTVDEDGSQKVKPGSDYNFKLTVYGANQSSVTCYAEVEVDDTQETPLSCDVWATDTTINRGDETTLKWESTGATDASFDEGIGDVDLDGSRDISPGSDRTYTLTVTDGNDSASCSVSIDVKTPRSGGGGSTPYCDLDISDNNIRPGEAVTLEWRTWNADEVILEDSDDNVLIDSDDEDDLDSEITIRPNHDLTFYLTAIDGNEEEECEVDVNVSGSSVVTQTRSQFPMVAGISLSQVPYTGFEAGPMLTFIFYAVLAIWGLFVAYVVAVRKGLVSGVSFAGTGRILTSEVSRETPQAANYVTAATAPAAATATATAPNNLPTGTPEQSPVIGYDAHVAHETAATADTSFTDLENLAHEQKALFSSDAMRHFTHVVPDAQQHEELRRVIDGAKATFPNEDGWVVINLTRLESLMETQAEEVAVTPETTTAGSLAEAIVTGNVVAAYQMIAHRPMIALADAAAELDTLLRVRSGSGEVISDMLQDATTSVTDEQLRQAIHALTAALDGTYSSEEEAVKMAILKATKAIT